MNKWYKSAPIKGVLLLVQHVLVVLAVISLVWLAAYPGMAQDIFSGKSEASYARSEGFGQQAYYDSQSILNALADKGDLETDGKLDENKLVDIQTLYDTGNISGENESGLAYTIHDLVDWRDKLNSGDLSSGDNMSYNSGENSIVVCQRPDGTYEYYYYEELKSLIDSGELSFMTDPDTGVTSEDVMNYLRDGTLYEGDGLGTVVDQNNQVIYRTIWNYDGFWIQEGPSPDGVQSILDIVNSDERWNGKLYEAYSEIYSAIDLVSQKMDNYEAAGDAWEEGNTNLTYIYADTASGTVSTNRAAFADYDSLEDNIQKLKEEGSYTVVRPALADFDSNMRGVEGNSWRHTVENMGSAGDHFVYAVGINTDYPVQDSYYVQNQRYEKYAPAIQGVIAMGVLSVVGILGILVWLTIVAGRTNRDEELHLNFFDRIKTELAAAVTVIAWVCLVYLVTNVYGPFVGVVYQGDASYYYTETAFDINVPDVVVVSLIAVLSCAVFMIGYLSLVRRIKAGTLWKNSILRWLCGFVRKVIRHMNEVWRIVVALLAVLFLHFLVLESGGSVFLFALLMFAVDVLVAVYMIQQAIGRNRLGAGIEKIAAGEVDYKIPLDGLKGGQRDIAGKINTIGEGLDAAVEASMKNERLKTDLITNVSHDIKTPLTSIINYVDLLKRENFTDPKIRGYLDVLEAKAQRLKTLTEDVVEASKVSSGNISLEYMNINLVEMIQQTSGEFEEKFGARGLKEVLTLPEEEAIIHVDGRRMWRVLENIYNNAAKYAMEGTRIYADLTVDAKTVTFNLKNVSEQPLNIDADELTERFIRGDVSRSTEGSGLGLSIAKSLTEMQGGTFTLYLDGDLFKVTITFPRVTKDGAPEGQGAAPEQ